MGSKKLQRASRGLCSTSFYCLLIAGLAVAPRVALADDAQPRPQTDDMGSFQDQLRAQQKQLEAAQKKIEEQVEALRNQEQALLRQQQQINALKQAVLSSVPAVGGKVSTAPKVSSAAFQAGAPAPQTDQNVRNAADTETAQPNETSGRPPGAAQPVERPEISNPAVASQGGVLTPKGVFSFEPSYQYQYSSNNQVVINGLTIVPGITIGSATIRQLVDRMQTFTLGGRLGVTNDIEVEAEVPYVLRNDSTSLQPLSASGSLTNINASGRDLGDIQFGAHYQINAGKDGWPYFVANLLAKSNSGKSPFSVPVDFNSGIPTKLPTGTGFWAIQPSVTAIYPSDPVVFFGNLRYVYNVGDNVTLAPTANTSSVPQNIHIKPGDGVGGSFGMGFGINDKASFSLAYEQLHFFSTAQNGVTVPGSTYDVGSFDLGFAYQVTQRIGINLGVAIGITKASPDTAVTLRVPIKFQVY